jgi:DNA-binding CsgD family transcriptional regulator
VVEEESPMTTVERPYCNAPRHGTYAAYHRSECRCDDAREDYNRYRARWSEGPADLYVSPVGVRRRVQALIANGHTYMTIATEAGLGRNTVWEIAVGVNEKVLLETAVKVSAALEALADIPGARRENVKYARNRGWAPPRMWFDIDDPDEEMDCVEDPDLVDEVLVERVIKGRAEAGQLNAAEKAEALRQMLARGATTNAVALRLHMSVRTVEKAVA